MRSSDLPSILEPFALFRGRTAEETESWLGGIGFGFEVHGHAQVDARLNGAYLPSLLLAYTQYGAAVTIETEARSDYWIQLPLRGGIELTFGGEVICCDMRGGAVTSPTRRRIIRTDEGSARLQVSLVGPALQRQLAALLGDWPRTPLELAPAIDLTQGYGRSLAHYVHSAISEFDAHGRVPWNALLITQFEQLIMTRLLLEHPHNHGDAVRRHDRPISPRGVKRAVDYIEANLESPIALADLVAVAGVPGRTLLQHFRAFKGVPPMRYLRDRRFERARRALLRAAPQETVTAIAMRWGFGHLGRFAIEYRRRFGERPSITLAEARKWSSDPHYVQAMQAQRQGSLLPRA